MSENKLTVQLHPSRDGSPPALYIIDTTGSIVHRSQTWEYTGHWLAAKMQELSATHAKLREAEGACAAARALLEAAPSGEHNHIQFEGCTVCAIPPEVFEDLHSLDGTPNPGAVLLSRLSALEAENERLRASLEPGKAEAIVNKMFEESERLGHSPNSCKHALTFLLNKIATQAAENAKLKATDKSMGEGVVCLAKLHSENLAAIVQMFRVTAEKGAVAALEFMGDHLDAGDAVGEGDAEIWQAASDRMKAEAAELLRLRDKNAQFKGIVEKLPKTADGVAITGESEQLAIPAPPSPQQLAIEDAKAKGLAYWIENGTVCTCTPVDGTLFGSHHYTMDGTSDCAHGCGCWMGGFASGGPVDPFGACPRNPLAAKGAGQ